MKNLIFLILLFPILLWAENDLPNELKTTQFWFLSAGQQRDFGTYFPEDLSSHGMGSVFSTTSKIRYEDNPAFISQYNLLEVTLEQTGNYNFLMRGLHFQLQFGPCYDLEVVDEKRIFSIKGFPGLVAGTNMVISKNAILSINMKSILDSENLKLDYSSGVYLAAAF